MRRNLILLAGVTLVSVMFAPAAGSQPMDARPNATAWWQVGPLARLTSAGMEDGQLLVEGLGGDDATQQAVAGLSFAATEGMATAELRIPVASAAPPDARFRVCTVTEPFEPIEGGSAEDIPAHDCSSASTAEPADDGQMLVARVGTATGHEDVRFLLVPDGLGRVVLDGNGARLRPGPAPAGPLDPGHTATPSPPSGPAPPTPGAGPSVEPARTAPTVPVQPAPSPTAGVAPPPSAAAGAGSPFAAPAAGYRPPASDASSRAVTAAIVALALGAFTAMNRGGTSRLRPATVPWVDPAR